MEKDRKMTAANAKFCNAVAKGDKPIKDCLLEAFPKYRGKRKSVIESQAHRLVTRPEIVAEIARIKEKFAANVDDEYAGLKKEMIDRTIKCIRTSTDGDCLTMVEFDRLLNWLSKVLGWEAPKDITLRNGGFTEDYRLPPSLEGMSGADIVKHFKALGCEEDDD